MRKTYSLVCRGAIKNPNVSLPVISKLKPRVTDVLTLVDLSLEGKSIYEIDGRLTALIVQMRSEGVDVIGVHTYMRGQQITLSARMILDEASDCIEVKKVPISLN